MNKRCQGARREILYLSLAGMDACLLVPIVLAVSQFAGRCPPDRATPAFFAIILLAFYLVRMLNVLDLKARVQRDVGLLSLLLWVLLALRFTLYRHTPLLHLGWLQEMAGNVANRSLSPQHFTLTLSVLVFWWRGLRLAQRPLAVGSVGLSFRTGVLIMVAAVAMVSQMLDWSPTPFVFGFIFLSLMAVALARAEEVGNWREGLPFPFSAGWLFSIAAAAGGVILITVGLIALITGIDLLQALALLGPVWDLARMVLLVVISVAFAILYPLLSLLANRLLALMQNGPLERPELLSGEIPLLTPEELVSRTSPFEPYGDILALLAMVGAILIVSLGFGRLWQARRRLGEAHVESAWGERKRPGGLGDRARQSLKSFMERLRVLDRWYAAASIRRIYAAMVAEASRRGHPRPGSDTPYEYLPTLVKSWPGMRPQLEAITGAYVRAHYGELPETAEELQSIRTAWDQIRRSPEAPG